MKKIDCPAADDDVTTVAVSANDEAPHATTPAPSVSGAEPLKRASGPAPPASTLRRGSRASSRTPSCSAPPRSSTNAPSTFGSSAASAAQYVSSPAVSPSREMNHSPGESTISTPPASA